MKQLNLQKMQKLYNLLQPYLPEPVEGLEILPYVGTIIKEMQSNPRVYIEALEIMTGVDKETLLSENGKVTHRYFLEGIVLNRMPEFQQFMRGK